MFGLEQAVNPDVSIDVDTRLGTDDGEMQICLSNWAPSAGYDSTSTVDILVEHAMRATNAGSIESACCLLEVCFLFLFLFSYTGIHSQSEGYRWRQLQVPSAWWWCTTSTGLGRSMSRVPSAGTP